MTRGHAVCILVATCTMAAFAAESSDTSASQVIGTARVQGRIIAADTGAVVRGAMVTCTFSGDLRQIARTDDDGRFECRDLPASTVTLKVVKAGFVETTVGLPVPLKEGQTSNRIDVRIVRGAVITGRVFDASGEPLVDAVVNAWRVGYPQPGNRRVLPARAAGSTNDLGEYRLYGLAPGTYYVSAVAQRSVFPELIASSGVQFVAASPGSPATFYPGTTSASEAQALIVQGGEQALGIDMRLLSGRQGSLSGRVVDSRGQAIANARVSLRPARLDDLVAGRGSVTDATGRFTMRSLASGEYRLVVTTHPGLGVPVVVAGQQPVGTYVSRSETPELASMLVTIGAGAEPANDLLIQTRAGNELRGRVLVDGAVPAPAASGRFMLTMNPVVLDGMSSSFESAAMVAADGTFVLPGLLGQGRLLPSGAPVGSTLLRVIANGLDVTDDGVDMDRGNVGGVEVHLTTRPTLVKGQVTDAAGKPSQGIVIAFSENPALWSKPNTRHVVSRSAIPSGLFEIVGLPAGRYLAVVVEHAEPDQWADPENLARLRPQATPFTVLESETMTLVLRRR